MRFIKNLYRSVLVAVAGVLALASCQRHALETAEDGVGGSIGRCVVLDVQLNNILGSHVALILHRNGCSRTVCRQTGDGNIAVGQSQMFFGVNLSPVGGNGEVSVRCRQTGTFAADNQLFMVPSVLRRNM